MLSLEKYINVIIIINITIVIILYINPKCDYIIHILYITYITLYIYLYIYITIIYITG